MTALKTLHPGDEAALEAFLAQHADTSMFLRSNARAAGLADRGAPMQGTYVAALEAGRIVGVAAHCWNGMVLVQAPAHAAALARAAVRRSRRPVSGLSGPWPQVVAARAALGCGTAPTTKSSREELYALDLTALRLPPGLLETDVRCRHPAAVDLELLADWRVQYAIEALGASDGPELRTASRAEVRLLHERGADWVVLHEHAPVAYAAFNAMLPEIVQVGGVWVPPPLRGRGYGRAVVAGALLAARKQSVQRAVLFADPRNVPARTAYLALGFQIVGDYGLVLLAP
ncbi:MAG TPA: GNAT family N-acetyltransferase [Gemmatimonadales bacterium]|nr:GNAT family N-acetyltransferase [Gemmatimonadales bacterium]